MILEVALLNVRSGQSAAFEQAFAQSQAIISSMPGYRSHQLLRCLEVQDKYLLLVNWDKLESHTVGSRKARWPVKKVEFWTKCRGMKRTCSLPHVELAYLARTATTGREKPGVKLAMDSSWPCMAEALAGGEILELFYPARPLRMGIQLYFSFDTMDCPRILDQDTTLFSWPKNRATIIQRLRRILGYNFILLLQQLLEKIKAVS